MKIEQLSQTIPLMESVDYKERFTAEYHQLIIRLKGLEVMLVRYKNGQLNFTPQCSYDILSGQAKVMHLYAQYLEERAIIENITLK